MRVLILLMALMVGTPGCRDNPPVVYPTTAPFDETKLALGPGDKLQLTIFNGSTSSSAPYTLDGAGEMEVQYIGTVAAAGKSTRDVQGEIQKRLADGYLRDPVVSLTIVEVNSRKCSVLGQVSRSGSVKFTPGLTITEAIAQSGGFAPLARKNAVQVTRFLEGKKLQYTIPVEMIGEGTRPNFPLIPGDEIFVPERSW